MAYVGREEGVKKGAEAPFVRLMQKLSVCSHDRAASI